MRLSGSSFVALTIAAALVLGCSQKATEQASAGPARAVQSVGILQNGTHPILDAVAEGCEQRLKQLLGDEVRVDRRNGGGDRELLRQEATRFVTGGYAALVSVATPASETLLAVSDGKIPIVFTFVTDPSRIGYGGPGHPANVTGLVNETGYEGTLDAIQSLVPQADTVGYLVSSEPNARFIQSRFSELMRERGLSMRIGNIQEAGDVPLAARNLASNVDAFLVGGDHVLVANVDSLLGVADTFGVPVFAVDAGSVERGALAASTIDYREMGERTAEYVSFILAGAKPSELPVEQYNRFGTVLNECAARKLGINVPRDLSRRSKTLVSFSDC